MVSHSHLSAGNSASSQSRDNLAEFGVSNPNSPAVDAQLGSNSEGLLETVGMAEADPNPMSISSSDSTSFNHLEVDVGPPMGAEASNIFKEAL